MGYIRSSVSTRLLIFSKLIIYLCVYIVLASVSLCFSFYNWSLRVLYMRVWIGAMLKKPLEKQRIESCGR